MVLTGVYEIAHLAGGRARVVDTALAALAQSGRVRVQRDGTLTVVRDTADDAVERAVLGLVTGGAWRRSTLQEAAPCVTGLDEAERLRAAGLLVEGWFGRALAALHHPWSLTADGRAALAAARTDGPYAVALGGLRQLDDPDLRDALLTAPARRRSRAYGDSAGAGWFPWGQPDGGSGGHAHGGCGASSGCGGGSSGCGGGSSGCGGGGGGGCGGGGG